ncbi:MAG: chorismate-binding protein [Actinomycetota bacterium]|nr:chorismate-binding protein [Actinomycetota bacterium]
MAASGTPSRWAGPLRELERWEWRSGDSADPVEGLSAFLGSHGLAGEPAGQRGGTAVALLVGAVGAARIGGVPAGRASPVPAVPELVAVALRPVSADPGPAPAGPGGAGVGEWATSWTDAEHAGAVETVRQAIARGDLYQANVVGHRSAPHRGDPRRLAAVVAQLPGALYGGVLAGGVLAGSGWAVGCGSPEQLVRLTGDRLTTQPIKGTLPVGSGSRAALLGNAKDRAEHVMIVDLERNDLSRVATVGTVEVERLYELIDWSGLWQARSTVAARLAPGATTLDVLRALLPGGSVTGAPKVAACQLLARLEPVGRGPSMGALGLLWPGGSDLGLTIRTIGADEDRVHLWAGGGITWSSDPQQEVEEAHAKARPVLAALAAPG